MQKLSLRKYKGKQAKRILTRYQRRKFPEFFRSKKTGPEDCCCICNEELDSTGYCPNCSGAHYD